MSLPGFEELPPPKGGPDAPTPSPVKEGKANESPEEAEAEVSDGAHSPRPLHKVGPPSAGPRVPTAESPPEEAPVPPVGTTPATNEDPNPKRVFNINILLIACFQSVFLQLRAEHIIEIENTI